MVLGITVLGPILSTPISTAQIKIEKVLNKLDAHYYYPHKKGLVNISAQLEWERQELTSEKKTVLKNPDFQFYGIFKDGTSRKGFIINENRVSLSDDEKARYMKTLNNFLDVFIPKTLQEKFSEYQGKGKFSGKGEMLLRFESVDSLDMGKHYELLVDSNKWRLAGLLIRQKHEPHSVKGKFVYTRKEGQWVVTESLSNFLIDGRKYSEKTEYTYKKIESFWLITKVKQTLQQDGQNVLLHRFLLSDYKINSIN